MIYMAEFDGDIFMTYAGPELSGSQNVLLHWVCRGGGISYWYLNRFGSELSVCYLVGVKKFIVPVFFHFGKSQLKEFDIRKFRSIIRRVFISSFVYIQRRIQNFQDGGTKTKAEVPTCYLAKFRQKLHENAEK